MSQIGTPFLALDLVRMDRNIARLRQQLDRLGVPLRPHVKTPKSVEVARRMCGGGIAPITVSTLREAEYFAAAGFHDQIYAVAVAPAKLARVAALRRQGVDVAVILDTPAQAVAVAEESRRSGLRIPALIEIDADGHRSGLRPDDTGVAAVAHLLERDAEPRGVLVHAGGSYGSRNTAEITRAARSERDAAVAAAAVLRAAGHAAPVVSIGSTPTAHFAEDLTGVTEVRAGVYVFMDLVMAGLGVCTTDDIAISVVATVLGHQRAKGWIITDAGWMAMSRDRGTALQIVDQGFGMVARMDGTPYDDLIVSATSQEHGIVSIRAGSDAALPALSVGDRVRIYPNHACATAAQFGEYYLLDGHGNGRWPRIHGW